MIDDKDSQTLFWIVVWLGVVFSAMLLVAGQALSSVEMVNLGRFASTAFFGAVFLDFISKGKES